jgi:dihydrofolate reductase
MIGGREIAKLFLENDMISEFLLTKIHKEYKGDSYFPLSQVKDWQSKIITQVLTKSIKKHAIILKQTKSIKIENGKIYKRNTEKFFPIIMMPV